MGRVSFLILSLCLLAIGAAVAQPEMADIEADALEQMVINGVKVRKFTGNVVVRQQGQILTAQEAFQYEGQQRTIFRGGVRIDQGNNQVITGDSLIIQGRDRIARIRGNVVYREGATRELTTDALDYHLDRGDAEFTQGGVITDQGTRLSATRGVYNRQTGRMRFFGNVALDGQGSQLTTDTLYYDPNSRLADFRGRQTRIVSADGTVTATRGQYNTETGQGTFASRSVMQMEGLTVTGDKVVFDRVRQVGTAAGRVVIFSTRDSITITGDQGYYDRSRNLARVYGQALMRAPVERDTLYIRADTLRAITERDSQRVLIGTGRVRVFQRDFQARCDSLSYTTRDSTIRFFRDPVLWADRAQITADTIRLQLEGRRLDSLIAIRNALLIARDTLGNFNQVKGRYILADFQANKIRQAYVRGNAQSLFFAVDEEKNVLTGLNRIASSNLLIRFDTTNRPRTITALVRPEAAFIPPHEIAAPDRRLRGFADRAKERPTRARITAPDAPPASPPRMTPAKPTRTTPSRPARRPAKSRPTSRKGNLNTKGPV